MSAIMALVYDEINEMGLCFPSRGEFSAMEADKLIDRQLKVNKGEYFHVFFIWQPFWILPSIKIAQQLQSGTQPI